MCLRSCHTVFQTGCTNCIPVNDIQAFYYVAFPLALGIFRVFFLLACFYLWASYSYHISSLCTSKPKGMVQTGPCGCCTCRRFGTLLRKPRLQTPHSFMSRKKTQLSFAPQEVLSLSSWTVNRSARFLGKEHLKKMVWNKSPAYKVSLNLSTVPWTVSQQWVDFWIVCLTLIFMRLFYYLYCFLGHFYYIMFFVL